MESVKVEEDRSTGRSRGFAFVEMSTPEEAAKAIELLSGAEIRAYGDETDHPSRHMNVYAAAPLPKVPE